MHLQFWNVSRSRPSGLTTLPLLHVMSTSTQLTHWNQIIQYGTRLFNKRRMCLEAGAVELLHDDMQLVMEAFSSVDSPACWPILVSRRMTFVPVYCEDSIRLTSSATHSIVRRTAAKSDHATRPILGVSTASIPPPT